MKAYSVNQRVLQRLHTARAEFEAAQVRLQVEREAVEAALDLPPIVSVDFDKQVVYCNVPDEA